MPSYPIVVKTLSILGALAAVSLVWAQQPSPAEALRAAPKRYAVKDIPDSYRAVALGGDSMATFSLFGLASMGGGSGRGANEAILFRLFNATWVDPDEFQAALEGKVPRVRTLVLDLSSFAAQDGGEVPTPYFTEGWLETGRITTWAPKNDLSKEELVKAFGSEPPPAETKDSTASLSQVKQIATATAMYASDYDDLLPKTNSTAAVAKVTAPYLKNNGLWTTTNPAGGRILYNVSLSGLSMSSFPSPAETVLLWEEHPWADGMRAVGFLDGHAKRYRESDWQKLWAREMDRRKGIQTDRAAVPAMRVGGGR
ncbi:hypothetical protein BH11ARM2_BH11ARM2_04980 [soil metagenome]